MKEGANPPFSLSISRVRFGRRKKFAPNAEKLKIDMPKVGSEPGQKPQNLTQVFGNQKKRSFLKISERRTQCPPGSIASKRTVFNPFGMRQITARASPGRSFAQTIVLRYDRSGFHFFLWQRVEAGPALSRFFTHGKGLAQARPRKTNKGQGCDQKKTGKSTRRQVKNVR